MPNAPYRIYAVRYAHRKCTTSEAFYAGWPSAMSAAKVVKQVYEEKKV